MTPEKTQDEMLWEPLHGESAHCNICRATTDEYSMEALRLMFPNGEADFMNFVLFSTSGVHGTYSTIEDVEKDKHRKDVTFLVVHPRLVSLRYGNCQPETPDDFEFLKKLRQSSWDVVTKIGA